MAQKKKSHANWFSRLGRYGAATALSLLVLGATYSLRPVLEEPPILSPLLGVVALVAILAGFLPALWAITICAAGLAWFFFPPLHSFDVSGANAQYRLLGFVAASFFMDLLMHLLTASARLFYQKGLETKQELKKTNDLLRATVDQTPAGIVVADASTGHLTYGNRMSAEIFGKPYPLQTYEDQAEAFEVFHPDNRPYNIEERPLFRSIQKGEVIRNEEMAIMRANGECRSIRVSSSPIRDPEGKITRAVAVIEDISEQKQAERARALLLKKLQLAVETRDNLLAAVSHDLKNPLAAILLNAKMIGRMKEQNPDTFKAIQTNASHIHTSADRMSRLVDQLLLASKMQSGRFEVHPVVEPANKLLAEIAEVFEPIALEKGIRFEINPNACILPTFCDPTEIHRVLSNIIGNALKFTPKGGTVRVEARRSNNEIIFSVTDNGPGISPEDLRNAFQWFWRAETLHGEGTGLGLAIAKGIIEAHGGRLWLESRKGFGTTAYFALPIAEGAFAKAG